MAAKKKTSPQPSTRLMADAIDLIKAAKAQVVRQTNSVMVFTYFHIGKLIVEHEQSGKDKAEYGKETIKLLSQKLTNEFGKGFSERYLENMRQFFVAFRHRQRELPIPQTVFAKLVNDNQHITAVLEQKGNKKLKKGEKTQTVSAEFSDDNQEVTPVFGKKGTNNLKKASIPQLVITELLNDTQEVTAILEESGAKKMKKKAILQSAITRSHKDNQLFTFVSLSKAFPLSWTHYIFLSRIENEIKYLKTA